MRITAAVVSSFCALLIFDTAKIYDTGNNFEDDDAPDKSDEKRNDDSHNCHKSHNLKPLSLCYAFIFRRIFSLLGFFMKILRGCRVKTAKNNRAARKKGCPVALLTV